MLSARMGRHAHRATSTHPLARRRLTAREMEARAAAVQAVVPPAPLPQGEAMAMLARRGFRPEPSRPDLPFPRELDADTAERLTEQLGHYSFRLFLRGAIQRRGDFAPGEATRYLTASQEKALADVLLALGVLVRTPRDRYRFVHRATSFGPTLEWYVARELRRRLGCDVATGVKFRAPGRGLPLLAAGLDPKCPAPRRIERDLWTLTPHLYAVSAKADLVTNICRVVGEGLIALGPRH